MLLASTISNRTRALTAVACFRALAASSILGLSVFVTLQGPASQRQAFGTLLRVAQAGPLCEQIVFDNKTSQIVSSGNVQCGPADIAHNFHTPLASLRRGFTNK